ncbi:MAG: polysaccharide biosynthesis tyrosine autokinase [Spirochaetales bacterium]|nr:polysaccharide biosynthesis tyrosine autokinase [Spirochaetales bacterium]
MEKQADSTFSIRDFFYLLFLYKGRIFFFFFVTLLSVVIGQFMIVDSYEAKAKILIKMGRETIPLSSLPSSQQQVVSAAGLRKEDIKSEIEIIQNQFIIERVVSRLGIKTLFPDDEEPESAFGRIKYKVKFFLTDIIDNVKQVLYELNLKQKLSDFESTVITVQSALQVKQVESTDVIEISVMWFYPELANKIVDAIIDEYMKHHAEIHQVSGSYEFFQEQVELIGARLAKSEAKLNKLKTEHNIISLDNQIELLLHQLSILKGEYKETLSNIAQTEASIAELKKQIDSLTENITPNMEEVMKEAETQLFEHNVNIKALYSKKREQEKQIGNYELELEKLNSLQLTVHQLERDIKNDEDNYNLYLMKLEEMRITSELDKERIINVRLISPAVASNIPAGPRKMLVIGLGLAIALIFSLALVFLLDFMDHSIKNADDISKYTALPVLATITEQKKAFKKRNRNKIRINEIGRLKNNLSALMSRKKHFALMVCSSKRYEGNTSIAINLARELAYTFSDRVLLIDANMYNPLLHDYFKTEAPVGLLQILQKKSTIAAGIKRAEYPNLYFISSGNNKGRIIEPIKDLAFKSLLYKLKTTFKFIVIDAPPVSQYSDSLVMAPLADGVLVITRAHYTKRETLQKTEEQLKIVNANILGIVLNMKKHTIPKFLYNML